MKYLEKEINGVRRVTLADKNENIEELGEVELDKKQGILVFTEIGQKYLTEKYWSDSILENDHRAFGNMVYGYLNPNNQFHKFFIVTNVEENLKTEEVKMIIGIVKSGNDEIDNTVKEFLLDTIKAGIKNNILRSAK